MSATAWIVVPVKPPGAGKTRLAGVLGPDERNRLVATMLARVFAAVRSAGQGDALVLLGAHRHGLPDTLRRLDDPGGGLDAALSHARDVALAARVDRILLLAADLPLLEAADVTALLDVPAGTVAIAPDRAGQGTNALSLPLPAAAGFRFGYGPDSFARHAAEADRLGLALRTLGSDGLASDIDRPEDLALLPGGMLD